MRWGAQHMYSRPSLPQKVARRVACIRPPTWLLSEQPERNSQTIVYRRLPASELSPSPREKLACQPMGGRAQSSSGNWSCTPVTPPPKPLPIGHKTCARAVPRLAREIRSLLLCLSPLLVPPPSWLVAQGWNVSSIGLAPAHGDGCLALCATALCWRSEDWCYAGPKIGVQPLNGHTINFIDMAGDVFHSQLHALG